MIVTLILAAGQSKRMGQLKQIMPWDGTVLLGKAIEPYQRAGLYPIMVVVGHEGSKIKKTLAKQNVIWIENPAYQEGMSSSIRAGIQNLPKETEAVLLTLGDLPLIKTETIETIIQTFLQKNSAIIVPTFQGKSGHPVLIDKKYFSQLLEITGDLGARKLLQDHKTKLHYVEVDDPGICRDIDDFKTYNQFRPGKEGFTNANFD